MSGQNTKGDLEWRGDCYLATECSASNGCDTINKSFNMLIQKVKKYIKSKDDDDKYTSFTSTHSNVLGIKNAVFPFT